MKLARGARWNGGLAGGGMGQMARFQETSRRLAMIDEGVAGDQAKPEPGPGSGQAFVDHGQPARRLLESRHLAHASTRQATIPPRAPGELHPPDGVIREWSAF